MTTRITLGVGANLLGQHAPERNQDASTAYVGNLDPQVKMETQELTKEQVLSRSIPWETYLTAKLINGTGLQLLRRYDGRPSNVQAALLDENGAAYIRVFVGILRDITKEETLEYVLAMIDEMLSANPKRARLFHDESLASDDIYHPFLRLLIKKNWFIQERSCKILTLMLSARPKEKAAVNGMNGYDAGIIQTTNALDDVLKAFVDWLCNQLQRPSHPSRGVATAVSSLATLLREPFVRKLFVAADGVKMLSPLIVPASSQQIVQLLYEATLCLWLLSFYDAAVEAMNVNHVLPKLIEVAKTSTKEKVVRVSILTLKNLLGKASFASEMVDLGLPAIVQSLKMQAWSDEDLMETFLALEEALRFSIKTLSSFDKYKQEVLSGRLDWTPTHKDATFWCENISKFEENDFQVLRVLITFLDTSNNAKTIAIACNDIAQFIQNHPSGRMIVLDLKAKDHIMSLMEHTNPEVRKEALLCVQKLLLRAKYANFLQS